MYVAEFLENQCIQRRDNHRSRVRHLLFLGFKCMWDVMRDNGLWLPAQAVADLVKARDSALLSWNALALWAAEHNSPHMWILKPKHHILDEMIQRVQRTSMNPAHHWAFGDEDFVGQIVRLSQKSHPSTVSATAVRRYRLRIALLFDRSEVGKCAVTWPRWRR